ncbi:uncharacterized protein LOC112598380 [Melanaphis sacchari]|uniref:uncharacterized protein LOC112598380 n=1 Tax=Melanaphis sacchari TaxID=742174 RepID=UPI000DC147BF|nr:uncharacterized protein LOC112598380 [Melanaphis sacchari]
MELIETSSEALQPDNVVVEYSSVTRSRTSSLSTNIDELNDNSFDTNITNICQTVIVDQSYPSDVDTRSKTPDNVVDSPNYFTFNAEDNRFTIGCLPSSSSNLFTSGKRYEVKRNKVVLERLIDIIKLIGKLGLSYRGAKDAEAAYTLNDPSLDHGNFLEMVMLLSKYDPVLKEHTYRAIYKSQKSKNRQTVSRPGRPGGLVTFLSKTTVDYIIEIIGSLMKTTIAENIRKAPFFTIQIDSTQDINVHDQLAIIIRFVTDDINEKLLAIVDCKSGKGKNLCDIVCKALNNLNLDVKNCIGSSTDGASNMRGQYNGFSLWLNKESPEQVHVWCYAHVLNLVMIDTTQVCNESTTLFGLLNSIAVFVRESYLRMNKWHENSKYKFISCIGDTRWWAKDRCLTKVFGTYLNPNECLYVEIIQTLNEIYESNGFAQDVRFKAKCFIDGLLKYETTKGMNGVHAFSMVKTTISTLQSKARDFNHIKDLTRTFIELANCKMDDIELEYNIEEKFPMKRIKKKRKMPGEIADDEAQTDPMLKFNINFLILEYFTNNLPSTAFEWISKKLRKFDSNISPGSIQSELKDFIEKWPKMKNIASATITINDDDDQENNEEDKNEENNTASSTSLCLKLNENLACKNCIICCFQVLQKYNLHSNAYRNLYMAYKYVLTLSCSQVRCETTFSKLKYVLNRLWNCLSQSKLETFLIMSVEKDILVNLNNNEIINELSKKNTKMANLLNM